MSVAFTLIELLPPNCTNQPSASRNNEERKYRRLFIRVPSMLPLFVLHSVFSYLMFLGHIDAPLVAGLLLLIPTTTSLSLHQIFTINSNTLSSPVSLSHLYQKRLRFCEHVGCLGCPCCCGSCVVSSCWRPAREQQKPNRMGQNDDCKAARTTEYRRG